MEVKGAKNHKFIVFIYEMLGTAMLMTGINWSSSITPIKSILSTEDTIDLKPIGITMGLYAAILIFGDPGGAHYNPAVTVGVFIKEGKLSNIPIALMMIFAQVVGAFLAEGIVYMTIPA